jgi:hypothetical protein
VVQELGSTSVIAVPKNWTKRLIHIDIDRDGDGKSDAHYRATGEHPFWTTERGWQHAVDLKIGDQLLTEQLEKVRAIGVSVEAIKVDTYNLSVAGVHTFYVVDAGLAVLVHNETPLDAPGHWNYHLEDAAGNVYYHGMAGPNSTPADVQSRHRANHDRFGSTDKMVIEPGQRTYAEARIMEDARIRRDGTLLDDPRGANKENYRGNRQRGISPNNQRLGHLRADVDACP